jgi:hypothetical protein
VLSRFTWARCAAGAVEQYREVLESTEPAPKRGGTGGGDTGRG